MVRYLGHATSKVLLSTYEKTRVALYIRSLYRIMSVVRGVILGKCGTGKTTFLLHARDSDTCTEISPTIGVDSISIKYDHVTFRCWATSGNERFREIIPMFIKKSDVAIYVFNTSDTDSMEEAVRW